MFNERNEHEDEQDASQYTRLFRCLAVKGTSMNTKKSEGCKPQPAMNSDQSVRSKLVLAAFLTAFSGISKRFQRHFLPLLLQR